MTLDVEIARAKIDYPGKGQDACCVRQLSDTTWLLALADGLTMNNGGAAAAWVIDHMRDTRTHSSARALLAGLREALARIDGSAPDSDTTVTAGLLKVVEDESGQRLRFDFFAAGDSPVWCVFRGEEHPPYQRHEIHGGVYPGELGRVYSAVRLGTREITGKIAFGSVEVARDEVLVVCSDGIPESTVFEWDFSDRSHPGSSPGLCNWLFGRHRYSNEALADVLGGYLTRRELTDDVTVIAARLAVSPAGARDEIKLTSRRDEMVSNSLQASTAMNTPEISEPAGPENATANKAPGSTNAATNSRLLALAPLGVALESWRNSSELGELPSALEELPAFLSPLSSTLNQEIADAVLAVHARLEGAMPSYSPRLYETMLSEAAVLLNRCEAYRREGEQVAALAIREAFSMVSRAASRVISQKAIEANLSAAESERSAGYAAAAKQFVDAGAREQALTDSHYYAASSSSTSTRAGVADAALQLEAAYDQALQAQFQQPNGALDYVGRYKSIATLIREDVAEAYERLRAAFIGMNGPAAQISVPAPPVPASGSELPILDALISWTRDAIRRADRERLRDQQYVVSIPLISRSGSPYFESTEATKEALGSLARGLGVKFRLDDHYLPSFASRLVSVGLSYFKQHRRLRDKAKESEAEQSLEISMELSAEDTMTFSGFIAPPRQLFPHAPTDSDGVPQREAKALLRLGAIGPYTGYGPASEASGPLLVNEYPMGEWELFIDSDVLNVWEWHGETRLVDGFVLHLTLVSRAPSPA